MMYLPHLEAHVMAAPELAAPRPGFFWLEAATCGLRLSSSSFEVFPFSLSLILWL